MPPSKLRIGTRGSALARWQAAWVAAELRGRGIEVDTILIKTSGDVAAGPLNSMGGLGVFTREIQQALLANEIDLAVHSLKDLPTAPTIGLMLAAVPERASVFDVLVCAAPNLQLQRLPANARIGTGSIRRRAQLLYLRSDLDILDIRGNVDTRLTKLDAGHYDGIVLAEAGLSRLGLADRISERLTLTQMLPAVGQGALGIEIRAEDTQTKALLAPLNDPLSHSAVSAEREMLSALRAGCLAPVGGLAFVSQDQLQLDAVVLDASGQRRLAASRRSAVSSAAELGRQVAAELLDQGAAELIQSSW